MSLSSGVRAGAAYVELYSKDSRFIRSMDRASKRLRAFRSLAISSGSQFIKIGGGVAAVAAISGRAFAKAGDQMNKMSARTGFSSEALSELGFAAEQSGADIETLEKGIRTMQRSIVDASRGLATQNDALEAMGLQYKDLAGQRPEKQFEMIAQAISEIEDPTVRAGVAAQFFGRAGTRLLPLFSGGADGMRELREEAKKLGLTISTDAAASAAELTDALNRSKRSIKAVAFGLGEAIAPGAIKAANLLTKLAGAAVRFVKENKPLVSLVLAIGSGITLAGGGLVGLGLTAGVVAFAISSLVSVVGVLGTALAASATFLAPLAGGLGVVVAGVVALGYAVNRETGVIGKSLDYLKELFGAVSTIVKKTFGGIRDALKGGDLKLAAEIGSAGIQLVWYELTSDIRTIWTNFETFILKSMSKIIAKAQSLGLKASGFLASKIGGLLGNEGLKALGTGLSSISNIAPGSGQSKRDAAIDARRSILDQNHQSKIDKLNDRLAELTKEAAEIAEQERSRSRLIDPYEFFALQSGPGSSSRSSTTSSGVFNARAAAGLVGSSNAEQKIQENTKLTYEQLKVLVDLARRSATRGLLG